MLDRLKAKIFPCEQLLRKIREDHSCATAANGKAYEDLQRVCINKLHPQFSHVEGNNYAKPH